MTADEDESTTLGALERRRRGAGGPPSRTAQLVAFVGQDLGRRYAVGEEATIGRAMDADVRLGDLQISRYHARLRRTIDGSYIIEDLGSHNGTRVNGKPVQIVELEYGDRIQLGPDVSFLFVQDSPLQDELLHRQKMEALGRLGASVAHDFSNLLGAALAGLDQLGDLPSDTRLGDDDPKAYLRVVQGAVSHAQQLAQRMLGMAGRSTRTYESFFVNELVSEALSLAEGTFREGHRVGQDIPADLLVYANRAQLLQLLMNLLLNAIDAMPTGGEVLVTAARKEPGELAAVPLHSPGPHVLLCVSDSGPGMAPEVRERVFEPFFSTKRGTGGAGLGLATVYEIALAHGGHAAVESIPDVGTTFRIYLPAESTSDSQRARQPTGAVATRLRPVRPPEGQRPLILVADDDEAARVEAGRILRSAGYDTLFVINGQEALAAYSSAERRPDLVLLDLHMPVLDGEQALAGLREEDVQVRIVSMSARADERVVTRLRGLGALGFVNKPFEESELVAAVQHALLVPVSLVPAAAPMPETPTDD